MDGFWFALLFYFLAFSVIAYLFLAAIARGSLIAALAMIYMPVSPVFAFVGVVSFIAAAISWFGFGFNPWPALWDWVTPGS